MRGSSRRCVSRLRNAGAGWKPAGAALKFPMKKLLNKLTHYSIGKVTPDLLSLLPGSDFLRERGEAPILCWYTPTPKTLCGFCVMGLRGTRDARGVEHVQSMQRVRQCGVLHTAEDA